jgi:hypothetical protein
MLYEFKGVDALEAPNRVMLLGSFNEGKQVRQLPAGGGGAADKWTILATGETTHLKEETNADDIGEVPVALLSEVDAFRWFLANVYEIPKALRGTAGRPVRAVVAKSLAADIEYRGEAGRMCYLIKGLFDDFSDDSIEKTGKELREMLIRNGGKEIPSKRAFSDLLMTIMHQGLGSRNGFSIERKVTRGARLFVLKPTD